METKYRIHSFYILLILFSVIVGLISVRWGEIPMLVQYFSFALTLSSLILATLAIIYSFYSSSTNSQNISLLNNLSNQIAQSARSLGFASDQLTKQIVELPSHLKNVQGKVEETQTLIKEYYAKQSSSDDALKSLDAPTFSKTNVELFLTKSSIAGLYLVYACELISKKKKEFEITYVELCKQILVEDDKYVFGYVVAATSSGILIGFAGLDKFNIKGVAVNLSEKIKPYLLNKPTVYTDEEMKERLEEIAKIESNISNLVAK